MRFRHQGTLSSSELPRYLSPATSVALIGTPVFYDEEDTVSHFLDRLHRSVTAGRFVEHLTPEAIQAIVDAARIRFIGVTDTIEPMLFRTPIEGFKAFLKDFDFFLKVDCYFIDYSHHKLAQFKEIALPENLNNIIKALRDNTSNSTYCGMTGRLWPIPVVKNSEQYTYSIGLRRNLPSKLESEPSKETLWCITENLTDEILQYDPTVGSMVITIAKGSDLAELLPSPPHESLEDGVAALSIGSSELEPQGSSRFRNESEAMDRLAHDPRHVGIPYEVGYLDRFDGLQWVALETWMARRLVEHMGYIPQHRIRKFRRRNDQVVVWDRENRFDGTD